MKTFAVFAAMAAWASAQGDLAALLATQPDLSTLLDLINLTGLGPTLSAASNITIIAPTNEAFAKVDPEIPEGIALANRNVTSVTALLQNHVFQGYYPSSTLSNVPTFVQSLLGPDIRNDVQPFTEFSDFQYNGIFKVDSGVKVVSGELTVSDVVIPDIRLGDGIVIHVVSTAVLFAPPALLYAAKAGYTDFNAAVTAAQLPISLGLDDGTTGTSNLTDFTIFIPNNEAFRNIGSVLATATLETLQAVLSYHVIAENVIFSPSLSNTTVAPLQPSSQLTFTVAEDGSAWVNNAKIIFPNVILSNGVAHVIDGVLNPLAPFDRSQLQPNAPAASRVAFAGATPASTLPFTSVSFSSDLTNTYSTPTVLVTIPAVVVATRSASVTTGVTTSTRTSSAAPNTRSIASYTGAAVAKGYPQAMATAAAAALAAGLIAI